MPKGMSGISGRAPKLEIENWALANWQAVCDTAHSLLPIPVTTASAGNDLPHSYVTRVTFGGENSHCYLFVSDAKT
jgi:hypothetical protein